MGELQFEPKSFLDVIDRDAQLRRMRVVFYDGSRMAVLREGPLYCGQDQRAIVIRSEAVEGVMDSAEVSEARDRRLYAELLNTGLSCSAAVIGWLVVVGGASGVGFTGGTSLIVSKLAVPAALASSAQCANAGYRVYNERHAPEVNDELDSQEWYRNTGYALDALSLAGAAASAATTIRMVQALRRSTGKSAVSVLRGLSRQERRRLTEEIVRTQNPGISNGQLKTMIRAGIYPNRYTGLQVSEGVRRQLMDALGAAVSFTGSATGGIVGKALPAASATPQPAESAGKRYAVGYAQAFQTM